MDDKPNIIIESLGTYLPPDSFSTDEVVNECANQIKFPLARITGIESRRMAGEKEFAIDLAKKAVEKCLENSIYNPEDIDIVICCNISREDGPKMFSFEPSTSIKLKKHFNFTNAIVFDISNACAGMFTGIHVVNAMIEAGSIRRGMVVSGEYITHLTKTAQREIESFMDDRIACLTLGDAGAAVILEKGLDNKTGFQKIDLQTYGKYSPYCIAKEAETGGWIMTTDSVNLTDVAMKSGTKYALDILEKAGWKPEECNHLLMHQTSRMTLNSARQEINRMLQDEVFDARNTINNLAERGNTASTSHMVAVADQISNDNIQTGDKIIFSISASGLTVGTALYVFDDLPDRLRQVTPAAKVSSTLTNLESPKPVKKIRDIKIESIGTVMQGMSADVDSMELLYSAAINCLEKSTYKSNDIELLMFCGVYRSDYILEPAYAALLAGKLDMNAATLEQEKSKTFAFDVFNGSMGFMNGLYIAQKMMEAEKYKRVMIVSSEIENNVGIASDVRVGLTSSASAIIIDSHSPEGNGFSPFHFKYDVGALDAYSSNASYSSQEIKLRMNVEKDPELESKYIAIIEHAVDELLEKEALELDQITKVFPPQISSGFIVRLGNHLKFAKEKYINVVGEGPDLFTSSLPFGMNEAIEKKLVKTGDLGLIITVGSGLQVGCVIYKF
jgi:3-oxoacyl-[acyl-carrier-protein] synthase III